MSDDVAIRISNVSKQFKLPHEKVNSVKGAFTSMLHRDKSFSTQKALNGISFDIKKGEFFGIVGRNGSGKSTLLKIIAGIYQPTEGSVQVHGKLVPFIELGVGFNPELTGRENVYLNGSILGFSKKQIDGYYDDVVEFAELEQFMDQKLKNYSSGMQVRLAFACATRAEADILLVDEVLAVGDADFQRKCFNYFRLLKKNKKTVIFVSHDMNSVREYCTRALLIDDSKVIAEGAANKISDEYTKLFIDSNSKTQVNSEHKGTGDLNIDEVVPINKIKEKGQQIEIKFFIKAAKTTKNAVAGFKLKSTSDEPIAGTNTKLQNCNLGTIQEGEKVSLSFKFDNVLNAGSYLYDLVLISEADEVLDWVIDAGSFDVVTEKQTGYILEPIYEVEYSGE